MTNKKIQGLGNFGDLPKSSFGEIRGVREI